MIQHADVFLIFMIYCLNITDPLNDDKDFKKKAYDQCPRNNKSEILCCICMTIHSNSRFLVDSKINMN